MILILLCGIGISASVFLFFRVRYREEELVIHTKEERDVYGHLFRPRFAGKSCPLVVLGHGYGGSYSDNLDYGSYLASHGIACYVFDFCGGSEDSKSSYVEMNLYTEIEDMNGIADYMLTQPWLQTNGLYLAGKSLGGSVAALTASERPEDVAGLLLHYPFFVISDAFKDSGDSIDQYIVPDVFERIAVYEKPVIIFNGDKDTYVPLEYSEQAAEAYKDARLVVLEGSGHGFKGANRQKVKEEMTAFILN